MSPRLFPAALAAPVALALLVLAGGIAPLAAADSEARFLSPFVFVATGSGVVVSADGEILTNNHVIAEAATPQRPALAVRLTDGGEWQARLIATDPVGDIALLRLEPGFPALRAAPFASELPPPGSAVVAVGNPFALGDLDDRATVTRGVLSTGRVVRGPYPDCLQHDAAVNPGNSGGPLFTPEGALLGINGAIRSRSGFRINSGIGLAIASPQLQRFLPALRTAQGGWVHRSAAPAGLELRDGPAGPAVSAAVDPLQVGDVVLTVDDRPAASAATVRGLLTGAVFTPGVTMPLRVQRAAVQLDLALPLQRSRIPGRPWHGLELGERAGTLHIDAVQRDSPAQQAGIAEDDLPLTVNGSQLANRLDWLRATAACEVGDRLELRLRAADGAERTVVLWLAVQAGQ